MAGGRLPFDEAQANAGDDGAATWEAARDQAFAASGVCCSIIEYPTDGDGELIEPPTHPPDGMARAVYCYRHERWMSVPEGSILLRVPEKKEMDLTGGAYDDDGGPAVRR